SALLAHHEPTRRLVDLCGSQPADEDVKVAVQRELAELGAVAAEVLGAVFHPLDPFWPHVGGSDREHAELAAWASRGPAREGRARPPAVVAVEQAGENPHVGHPVARRAQPALPPE